MSCHVSRVVRATAQTEYRIIYQGGSAAGQRALPTKGDGASALWSEVSAMFVPGLVCFGTRLQSRPGCQWELLLVTPDNSEPGFGRYCLAPASKEGPREQPSFVPA
jgi:hypothetical protein|uniref:Uncharacterized protein n=1 Tax=Eutreptiella gymnastica TaxID=73025 RepID=A0A7S4LKH2_9EUGL